jgi:hypothetical protein
MNWTRSSDGASLALSTPKISCDEGSALAAPTATEVLYNAAVVATPRIKLLMEFLSIMSQRERRAFSFARQGEHI